MLHAIVANLPALLEQIRQVGMGICITNKKKKLKLGETKTNGQK